MGKRKERRVAAMMATSRRVKLDLFAEPPGDSGGSSAQDELGGGIDPRHHAGSPNSPSSSGKQLENPLSLLGQYSDEESEEESSKQSDHTVMEKSSADDHVQAKDPVDKKSEDVEISALVGPDSYEDTEQNFEKGSVVLDALQSQGDNDAVATDGTNKGDLCEEVVPEKETSNPVSSDVKHSGDVNSSWRMVLHEESNQYYYWNTVTGETSWVVPLGLSYETESTGEEQTVLNAEGRKSSLAGSHGSATLDVDLGKSVVMDSNDHPKAVNRTHGSQGISENGGQSGEQNDGCSGESSGDNGHCSDVNLIEVNNSSVVASTFYHTTTLVGKNASPQKSGNPLLGTNADSENMMVHEDDEGDDLSTSLVKHGESLLRRLTSLKGFISDIGQQDWISKTILEVQIRLHDIKSLLPFGSSLLPFWVHCEGRLKQLEDDIDNGSFQYHKSKEMGKAETAPRSHERGGNEIEVDKNGGAVACSGLEASPAGADDDSRTVVQIASKHEVADNDLLHVGLSAIDSCPSHSIGGVEENLGSHGAGQPAELIPKTSPIAGEDVDMDVDMEVEDVTTHELPIQPNPCAEDTALQESFCVPPPPDEEWIPPPPPDNELIPPPPPDNEIAPPPPPDDAAEPSYPLPSSYSETVQSLSYTDQYNLHYPSSGYEYYGQTSTQFPQNDIYGQTEGCQVAVPHPSLYYEALPSTYPGAAPVVVNPIPHVVYYGHQDGAALPAPLGSSGDFSGLPSYSCHDALSSDQIKPVKLQAEAGCVSTSANKVMTNGGFEKASKDVPSIPASLQAPSTTSINESASGPSTTVITGAAVCNASTVAKAQAKVSRNKRRSAAVMSTLRSNKKVSTLVDKWKAAKEELHEEEEEEPESAYEILEKKRQREIEEWRAQQIASGEAKENANFQPLGGDWRERVKRRRAQLNNETLTKSSSESPTDGSQQPDLNEISRDLPSGWQAYWDESTKQVYYGNTITSETTWTRPAC